MLNLQHLALELLEYKVKDLMLRRKPLGGTSSAWVLYDHLLEEVATLSVDDRRRFEAVSRDLKRYGEIGSRTPQTVASFDQLVLDGVSADAVPDVSTDMSAQAGDMELGGVVKRGPEALTSQTPAEQEEQRVLKRLARKVWWHDVERVVQRLAASSRAERDRATVRMAYALLRNLSHCAQSSSFFDDLELKHFTVKEAVSELADPLASFNDIDSIKELYYGLVETILSLTQAESPYRVNMPAQRTFGYMRKMALLIAQDPYAGQVTAFKSKSASSKQLRMAMEELGKEPVRPEERQAQRRQLELRLNEALAHEKSQRQLFERDVLRYQEVVDAFFNQLRLHLPKHVGGEADEPQLPGGVLFAENPALRLEEIPKDSHILTVQLKGPLRFQLADVPVAVVGSGQALILYVDEQEHLIDPAMDLEVGRQRLNVFREGNYLHLRLSEATRALAVLAAEALVVAFVLRSPSRAALLSVLKTATGVGANEPQEIVRLALEHFKRLTAKVPDVHNAVRGFVQGSLRAANVAVSEAVVEEFTSHLHRALTVKPEGLDDLLEGLEAAKTITYQLEDEPINLTLAGLPLTIRQYRGRGKNVPDNVVVMMPGRPLGSFTDYLVEPFVGGMLVSVKAEEDLLMIFFAEEVEAPAEPG